MKANSMRWIMIAILVSVGSAGLITLSKKSNIQRPNPQVSKNDAVAQGQERASGDSGVRERELTRTREETANYDRIIQEMKKIENEPIDYETKYPQIAENAEEKEKMKEKVSKMINKKMEEHEKFLNKMPEDRRKEEKEKLTRSETIAAEKELNVIPQMSLFPSSFWVRKPRKSVNFIHFNDVYEIRFLPYWVRVLRFYTQMLNNPSIVFSGDIIGPSTVSAMLGKQEGIQFHKLFHDFRIDVSVPGNHEGDFEEPNFKEFVKHNLDKGREEAYRKGSRDFGTPGECEHKYPKVDPKASDGPGEKFQVRPGAWLLSNVIKIRPSEGPDDLKGAPNWGNLRGAIILKINGFKVGFFGLVDDAWINGSTVKKVKHEYNVIPFKEAAQKYSRQLKEAGCHFVAAVTHMTNADDEELLKDKTNSVDFVFGGHEHIFLIQRLNNRILIKSGADFKQFSAIRFELFKGLEELKSHVTEVNKDLDPLEQTPQSIEKDFGPWVLDDLNKQQLNTRAWNFPIPYSFEPPKDNNGELRDKDDAEIAQYKYLNIYVERADIKFDQRNGIDQGFMDDYMKNFFPFVKPLMRPAFQFENAVDIREPQIYEGETPIGDFLTDIIKADTGADIVILNAGSIKSEFAFPQGSVVPIADAKRMLQRSTPYIKTMPKLKTLRKIFLKNLNKISSNSADFPVFAGIKIKIKSLKGILQSLEFIRPKVWSPLFDFPSLSENERFFKARKEYQETDNRLNEQETEFLKKELEFYQKEEKLNAKKIAESKSKNSNANKKDELAGKTQISEEESQEEKDFKQEKKDFEKLRMKYDFSAANLDSLRESYFNQKFEIESNKEVITDENQRFSLVTLDFIINSYSGQEDFFKDIKKDLSETREEWYRARLAADKAMEMRDYYHAAQLEEVNDKIQNNGKVLEIDLIVYEDYKINSNKLESHSNMISDSLEVGHKLQRIVSQFDSAKEHILKMTLFDLLTKLKELEQQYENLMSPSVDEKVKSSKQYVEKKTNLENSIKSTKEEIDKIRARSLDWEVKTAKLLMEINIYSAAFYFPPSYEPLPPNRHRPYDSLQAFYDLSANELGHKMVSGIFKKEVLSVFPEAFQDIWKTNMPTGIVKFQSEVAENWDKLREKSTTELLKNQKNIPKDPILAKFRTITDEKLKQEYRFLSLMETYNFKRVKVFDLSSDKKTDQVEVLSVRPINRRRLVIEDQK